MSGLGGSFVWKTALRGSGKVASICARYLLRVIGPVRESKKKISGGIGGERWWSRIHSFAITYGTVQQGLL